MIKTLFPSIKNRPEHRKLKIESNLVRIAWRVLITTRWIIQKPRKLGGTTCIAWRPAHAAR